jgi:hypothetical protein
MRGCSRFNFLMVSRRVRAVSNPEATLRTLILRDATKMPLLNNNGEAVMQG